MGEELLLHLVRVDLRQLVHHIVEFRVVVRLLRLLVVQTFIAAQNLPILVLFQQEGRGGQFVLAL